MASLRNAVALVSALLTVPGVASAQDWWDDTFTYRQELPFLDVSGAEAPAALTHVPVLVKLSTARITYGDLEANGEDLRFIDHSGPSPVVLDYEIEDWNASGDSAVWVRVPAMSSGGGDSIYAYWGKTGASDDQDPAGVWRSEYRAVYHLDDLTDSTGATTLSEPTGDEPAAVAGFVAGARDFDDANTEYLTVSTDLNAWLGQADFSMAFLVQTSDSCSSNTPRNCMGVTGIQHSGDDDDIFVGYVDNAGGSSNMGLQVGEGAAVEATVADGAWHHVVFTRDASTDEIQMFLDGVLEDTADGDDGDKNTSFTSIGRIESSADPYLDATLDEIRFYNGIVSLGWVQVQNASVRDLLVDWCDTPVTWYEDSDGDGFGNSAVSSASCAQPLGWVLDDTDCDDGDDQIGGSVVWYLDDDDDGHGGSTEWVGGVTCVDPSNGGDDYVTTSDDDCDSDPYNWTTAGCACDDDDSDGLSDGCDSYEFAADEDHCDDDEYNWTTDGCACDDDDSDGLSDGCDSYEFAADEDHCDNDQYNWTTAGCACDDDDSDGRSDGCDSYEFAADEDHCDGDEYNWTVLGCACDDDDSDGRSDGCDSYASPGDQDFCDDNDNAWTSTACTNCLDTDTDGWYVGCDTYASVSGPDQCPADDNNWTSAGCANCMDGDVDGFYVDCDAYNSVVFDCNDLDAQVNPNTVWYVDGDIDGYGGNTAYNGGTPQCADPSDGTDYAPNTDDCNDGDPTLNPDTVWYLDDDDDGYGDPLVSVVQCADPSSGPNDYVRNGADCDDTDENSSPDTVWYADSDGDTWGSEEAGTETTACDQPGGYVARQGDCDDDDDTVYTGATETCGDGVDSNCDGTGGPTDSDDADGISWQDEDAVGANDCSLDSDADGVPDAVEYLEGNTDSDGLWDIVDPDDDGDGAPTLSEDYDAGTPDGDPTNDDTDDDDTPDYLDDDDDGDGIDSIDEDLNGNLDPRDDDVDSDGLPNFRDDEDDGDGIPTTWELAESTDPYYFDSDDDGVDDGLEWGPGPGARDWDGDLIIDPLDDDDDDDGVLTQNELPGDFDGDEDCFTVGDGIPNYLDIDSDADGVCDGTYPTNPVCSNYLDVMRSNGEYIAEDYGDYDSDGIPNIYDCDDLVADDDFDRDGLTNSQEDAICATIDAVLVCMNKFDPDSDADGIPDGIEVGSVANPNDSDGDGIWDPLDTDDDGDNVPTAVELDGFDVSEAPDTDDDLVPDYLDVDDDGDGIDTIDEDWNLDGDPTNDDIDGDLLADYLDDDHLDGPLADRDGDGVNNGDELAGGTDPDVADHDGDGVLDGDEYWDDLGGRLDTDDDGIFDAEDPDDDGDGIPTALEGSWDADADGVPNYLDLDSDGDTLDDRTEGGNAWEDTGELPDSDQDGVPDFLDPSDDPPDDGSGPVGTDIVDPGCACGAVPAPAGGLGGLLLVLLGLARRRP